MDADLAVDDFPELFEDDKKSFLSTKLEEVRLQNEVLEAVLNTRKKALEESVQESPEIPRVENSWINIFNGQYCMVFEVSSAKVFRDVKVLLRCSGQCTSYTVNVFHLNSEEKSCFNGKNCRSVICGLIENDSTILMNRAYVTVVFARPEFIQASDYDLSGYITCTSDPYDHVVPLPNMRLSVTDSILNPKWLHEKNPLLIFFTVISCNSKIDLVMCLPEEWTTPLISTFEINCSLTYVPIVDKAYFVANNISQLFDDTLLVIHPYSFKKGDTNDIFVRVYSKSNKHLFAFIHHLLSCVPNSVIFPNAFYVFQDECRKALHKQQRKTLPLEDFIKQMRADIKLSYSYLKTFSDQKLVDESTLHSFKENRCKLSEQELLTDLCYIQTTESK